MSEYRDKMLDVEPSVRGIHSIHAPLSIISSCVFARHAMLVDQSTESVTVPLNVSLDAVGKLELANSMFLFFPVPAKSHPCIGSLSEFGVLGVSRMYMTI